MAVRERARRGLWILALGLAARLGALEVPFLAGHVNDQAGLLNLDQGRALEERLTAFEEKTGHQVVVLTVASLEGEVLEDYSVRVAETWKLGREGHDDGVLLLVARDDRKLRLEVGYGLEATLTDLTCQRILDERIVPRFKEGDFARGIDDGIGSVLGLLEGDASALPEPADSLWGQAGGSGGSILGAIGITLFVMGILSVFSLMALFAPGGGGWFLYLFMIPFNSLFPIALFGGKVGGFIAIAWIVGAPILRLLLPKTKRGKRIREKIGPIQWSGGGGGGGGRSWSSGSSGGGFSGGGGSFGGGGASSSW